MSATCARRCGIAASLTLAADEHAVIDFHQGDDEVHITVGAESPVLVRVLNTPNLDLYEAGLDFEYYGPEDASLEHDFYFYDPEPPALRWAHHLLIINEQAWSVDVHYRLEWGQWVKSQSATACGATVGA
jgi:hypothetical protein